MAKKRYRPGRTLLVFFISVAVLYGLAALGGTWKPQLGLDLRGGTRITLTAAGKPGQTKLNEARDIVEKRVNAGGVTETDVTTQGGRNVVVEIPGKNRQDLVDAAQRTAQLRFRLVAGQPQAGTAGASSGASSAPSTGASPSAAPSTKAGKKANQSGKKAGQPKQKSTAKATPKPRPAPAFDRSAAKKHHKKPVAKQSPTTAPTTAPATSPTTPQAPKATSGASSALAWAQNPPAAWQAKYAAYQCPTKGEQAKPIADDPKQPLITCDDKGQKFLLAPASIEGTSLKTASYGTPQNGVGWVVTLALKGQAVKTFATISRALYSNGGLFAVTLDGKVISYASVTSPILDGNAQIEGSFTEGQARSLANSLKFGALPVRFLPDPSVETIGPSLAGNQLQTGILAGVVGLAIVMLYCLLYYRGLGLVVIASLVVAGIITYATVLVLSHAAGFTLTLPGIAGLIVAVGITADSFIVYFERIRDEMRDGKSMRVATEAGWVRARNTCLAADAVSFLAAVVLYIFAIGVVKGFAFTLGISTIIDVVVFFFFTKPMISLLARRRFFNTGSRFSGLSRGSLGVDSGLSGGNL